MTRFARPSLPDRVMLRIAQRVNSVEESNELDSRQGPMIIVSACDGVLLGPDSESQQWVGKVARLADRPYEVVEKLRTGDRAVDVSVPESAAMLRGTPLILDDIASSGRTMVRTIERLLMAGTPRPLCLVIHGIFAGTAFETLSAAGARRAVTTDTVPHSTNGIGVAALIAHAIQEIDADVTRVGSRRDLSERTGSE